MNKLISKMSASTVQALDGGPHQPRRRLLLGGGLGAMAAFTGGLATLATPWRGAHAADYKAMVCVMLFGGNDGNQMVVPTDARYGQYASIRAGLALPQASLVPLPGVPYGVHPALAALVPHFQAGHAAPVFNTGPLLRPMSKAQVRAAAASELPEGLFSHSDQQACWETGTGDSQHRTGWGGRATQVLGTVNPVLALGGSGRYGVSDIAAPLSLPGPGATFGAYELGSEDWRLTYAPLVARSAALRELYNQTADNPLADALVRQQRAAFEVSDRLRTIVAAQPGGAGSIAAIDQAFAPIIAAGRVSTPLGQQLYQVAKLIAHNATVQGNRQVYVASLGGFDTHGDQVVAGTPTDGAHARLLKQLGDAMACFHAAMVALGLGNAVTSFTQSDFGRTLKPNGSWGSDHGWGNHQWVLGGAVQGGRVHGQYPDLALGGASDIGVDSWELHGRWVPTASVDQYAATLLRWFGATETQLDQVLPNLVNFGAARSLGFV